MIKMTYQQTRGDFKNALMQLAHQSLPVKISYNVKKIVDALKSQERIIIETFQKEVAEKFAKRDEKGEFIRPKDDPKGFEADETKEAEVGEATEAFGKREFTIDRNKLSLADFMNVNISAANLAALDPIMFDPSEEDAANVTVIPRQA